MTSSTPAPERAGIITLFASGDIDVLVGTHALLEDDVQPAHLTLAIIDEQQRFGVEQRARLLKKGQGKAERKAGSDGISVNSNANIPCAPDAARTNPDAPCAPDALYLTATPIPRSLALALFGGLSLSYIKERPHNNVQRTTKVCRKQQLGDVYDKARAALERGEQVYVVCPLVGKSADERNAAAKGKGTEAQMSAMAVPKTKSTSNSASSKPANKKSSEKSSNPFDTELDIDEEIYPCISIEADSDLENDNVSAAITEARILEDSVFSCWKVALLHGKMPSAEKVQVMQDFREGKIQVLVATTVIEVGVDVPNATVMIIQDADRFGLSQLHQLRGRVGRGCKPGEVYLVSASSTEAALARLRAMESTEDGFELASFDLSLRREGDILGNRQSGASSLKLVNVVRDKDIIEAAHVDAKALLEADPYLEEPKHRALAREMHIQFKNEHAKAGG